MDLTDKLAQRLALLDGVDNSPAELESIANEIEDNLRVVAELEEFAKDTPWISQQQEGCLSDLPKSTNFLSHHADSVCADVGIVRQVRRV
jgi:hypothetical protein